MSDQTILETIDPEVVDTLVSRREAIRKGASVSALTAAGLAAGSIPLALAALASDARAQQTGPAADIITVLKFAYLLENLEAEFYKTVLGTGTGFSATNNPQAAAFAPVRATFTAGETAVLNLIRVHEEAHVALLKTTLAGAPFNFAAPTFTGADFDFTGGSGSGTGPFAGATTSKPFLLVATQGFEDTGVRAYKGQAGNLMSNDAILETALRIHSVEARHAAKIRRLRRSSAANATNAVLRYSGTIRGGGAAAAGATDVGTPPAAVVDALNAI
jgi:hypothetical protein